MQCLQQEPMDLPQQPACCRVSLTEICSLYQRLFQTPVDINSVQAAVDQVCGVRLHSAFCCSSRLLDVLVEVERRRWVKEQIYWDFQLLDFNRDSSLSLSDVKILLQRAQESQITSMSWVDFLTQRQETSGRVTWSELEACLFEKSPPSKNEKPGASLRAPEDQLYPVQYQEDMRKEKIRLKRQWDSGGLADLVRATEETDNEKRHHFITEEDLSEAVELKFAVLREKLFCDMLQAHYGAQVWASMDVEHKEKTLKEFKMLAQFGLEKGSELILSQLPGATYSFRAEDSSCACKEMSQTWTAVQGLKELQRRLEIEKKSVGSAAEEGSSISMAHQYFLLFAQTYKVKMENNFGAAVLVVEPHWEHRFWDGTPMCLEACYEELAHNRLTTGQRSKSKMDKQNRQKMPLEEDKILSLLKRQEEARDLLFQLLQSCSHKELQEPLSNLLHKSEEPTQPTEEISGSKIARNPLRDLFLLAMTVTKTCLQEDRGVVTWGDCAVRLLVQVQLKQELELRELIQELVNRLDSDLNIGHQTIPYEVEGQDPVSDLIHLLQPLTPQEQLGLNQPNMTLVSSKRDPIKETDPHRKEQYLGEIHDKTEAEADNRTEAGNESPQVFLDSTHEVMTDKIKKDNKRKKEFQEMHNKNDKCKRSDEWVDPKMMHEHGEKGCNLGQNNTEYRNTVIDSPSQTEYMNEHTENLSSRKLPGNPEIKLEESIVCGNESTDISTRGHENKVHGNVHEQVPQTQIASSVLEATEGLLAGLMTLKVRVEQVYMMRGIEGNPFQRLPKNIIDELPVNTQVSASQNKTMVTPMENSMVPKAIEQCDTSSHEAADSFIQKESKSEPSKEIYCSNEGKGAQTEGCKSHPDPVKQKEIVRTPKKQENEEEQFEKQRLAINKELASLSSDAGTNQNNDLSRATTTNIHRPSVSSEQVASAVMEAAENLIGSLKSLKEEISRASQSQITKQEKGTSTTEECKHLEDTQVNQDNTKREKLLLIQPGECKALAEDKQKNEKSLEDEAIQTYEEVPPHVPEPMIREVSWEVHPECSHGCSHAKLWDSEQTEQNRTHTEQISGKNLDSEIKKTEESTEIMNAEGSDDKKQPVNLQRDSIQKDGITRKEYTSINKENARRHRLDHNVGEYNQHASVTSIKDPAENGFITQKEHGGDATSTMALMASSSKYSCSEPDSADKLALSFLEAAQNLIGGLIPGKEDVVGRVVVILTDGATKDGDVILDQGEEFSEASGTISIMEGSSGEESRGPSISKEDEEGEDPNHKPTISESGVLWKLNTDCVLDDNYAEPPEECPGGHCTKKNEIIKQADVQDTAEIEMTCHSEEGVVQTLVESQDQETEEELFISTTEEALNEGLCEMANEPDPELYLQINADSEYHINEPVLGLQKANREKTKYSVKEGTTNDHIECLEKYGCEEPWETIDQENTKELNCNYISKQKSVGENIATKTVTNYSGDPVSQADTGMNKSILMTTTDRDDGTELINYMSGDRKETQGSHSDMQYTTEGKSICKGHLENEDEENLWNAENKVTIKIKTDEALGSKKDEHKDLHLCRGSPDSLVKNVLLATQDLIGSLTSLKESMGNNVRTTSQSDSDNVSNESTTEQTHEQNFSENTFGDGYQSCATLDFQRNKDIPSLGSMNNICDLVKAEELTEEQNKNAIIKGDNEGAEQKIFVPSIAEVLMPSESFSSYNEEMPFARAYMEPDSVQQDCKNLKNKWRSISENHILKSCISERLKIKPIEKSKSDSASYKKSPDPSMQVISGIVEPEQEHDDQLCLGNEDMKMKGHTLRSTNEHNESKVIFSDNTEDESQESDLNDPDSLKDLTVSLLEATGSRIGRLASLKAELGNSQTDVISHYTENLQIVQNVIEHVNKKKTLDETILAPLKQMSTMGNEDEIHNGKHIGNDNVTIDQVMSEVKTDCKPVTSDGVCKENIQVHRLSKEQVAQSKEEEINTKYFHSDALLTVQGDILKQNEECHQFKETQTTIPDFSQEGDQHGHMKNRNNDQVLQEQNITAVPVGQTIVNISSVEELGHSTSEEYSTEDTPEEQKTSYTIQEIFSQQSLNDISKSNLISERNEGTEPDEWIEDIVNELGMATEIPQVEGKSKTEEQVIKDLSDIYSLRKHIKYEVTKRKSDYTEEQEEDKWSCSHRQNTSREQADISGKGTFLGQDNLKIGSNELANNDDNAMNENMEQNEENYKQEGKKDQEAGTDQPTLDCTIERGAKSKDASVKQAVSQWFRLKEEAAETLAETVQSDDTLNDMPQVPANGVLVRNEAQLPCSVHTCRQLRMVERSNRLQDTMKPYTVGNNSTMSSIPLGQAALQREKVFIRLSLREQQEALQRLRDLQREAELKCTSDRRRQMLRFQERLSIARNKKSELDLMDITQRRSPQMTPEPLPEGGTERQKSAVRERLEKMKRERTYIMQTRRDRNMSSFRELLDPVLANNKREDSGSELRGAEGM